MADKIVVPIESKYDDKGAKAALKDAEKVDKAKPTLKVTSDAKGALTGLKAFASEIKGTEGGLNKFKAAGKGVFDTISANASTFATGAGTALAAFGVKAVGEFTKLASSVGELRDTLGLSAEQASRWNEVAGDLGISTQSLETSMGKMLRTAGSTPKVFADLGVKIARTKDGAVDANGTFLNTINALHNMTDPARRAAAAQQLLGKSWQDSAELIAMGADQVQARLADVSGAKIVSDAQIAQGRKFRDVMDDLHDQVENVTIVVGEELVPALSQAAETANSLIGPLEKVKGAFDDLTHIPGIKQVYENFAPWKQLPTRIHQVTGAFNAAKQALTTGPEDIAASLNLQTEATNTAGDAVEGMAKTTVDASYDAGKALADWATGWADAIVGAQKFTDTMGSVDFHEAEFKGAADGMARFEDQFFGLSRIAADTEDAFANLGKALHDNGKTFDLTTERGRANQKALEGVARTIDTKLIAAYDDADGNQQTFNRHALHIAQDTLNRLQKQFGLSADQARDLARRLGLLPDDITTRYKLAGTEEARTKIGLLQSAIDKLPDDVQTRVTQRIIVGDYQGALNIVQGYYTSHPAGVDVNAHAGDVSTAHYDMQNPYDHNPLTVKVNAVPGGGLLKYSDKGGRVGPDGAIVAERRPEFVRLPGSASELLVTEPAVVPAGTQVTSGAETERILAGRGSSTAVTNVVVNVPRGYHGNVLEDARKAARRSGGLYQRNKR